MTLRESGNGTARERSGCIAAFENSGGCRPYGTFGLSASNPSLERLGYFRGSGGGHGLRRTERIHAAPDGAWLAGINVVAINMALLTELAPGARKSNTGRNPGG